MVFGGRVFGKERLMGWGEGGGMMKGWRVEGGGVKIYPGGGGSLSN